MSIIPLTVNEVVRRPNTRNGQPVYEFVTDTGESIRVTGMANYKVRGVPAPFRARAWIDHRDRIVDFDVLSYLCDSKWIVPN